MAITAAEKARDRLNPERHQSTDERNARAAERLRQKRIQFINDVMSRRVFLANITPKHAVAHQLRRRPSQPPKLDHLEVNGRL